MASNPDFLWCKEERKQESFFKVLKRSDMSSEDTRAIPYDFVINFSDNELSGDMKFRVQWGNSWKVKISKNPRFYFMEKSGWEKFVIDNALGDHEFLTFTHKGQMSFTVKIFNKDGKEMMQPPQSRASFASSSRVKTEQDVKREEEVLVSSDSRSRGPTTAAETNRGGSYKRKLNFGKKKAEETQTYKRTERTQNSKRTERVVSKERVYAGEPSSSVAGFKIFISKSYIKSLAIPKPFGNYMPKEKTRVKIHHPDGEKTWKVVFVVKERGQIFSGGWKRLCKEYPVVFGDTCKFTLITPLELLLVVSKP